MKAPRDHPSQHLVPHHLHSDRVWLYQQQVAAVLRQFFREEFQVLSNNQAQLFTGAALTKQS
jgi:hypothetical protein